MLVILLRVKIVALLAEGVDRNLTVMWRGAGAHVALLAEGVDRNMFRASSAGVAVVALLAEGVDRNRWFTRSFLLVDRRPPRGGRG